jgi:hypothetical protein
MKKWYKIFLLSLAAVLLLTLGGFTLWAYTPLGPSTSAMSALQSDALVFVSYDANNFMFAPMESTPVTGLIFYPGGRVDYRSYAPLLRQIALQPGSVRT